MKNILHRALIALALITGFTPAIAQQFPTVPGRSVIGRLGLPGDTGPSQAIPFITLQNALTNYTAPFTGGIPRTLSSKLSDTVHVRDFGARCDGSTDDTIAIQRALNTGKTVKLPEDLVVCKITSTLNITHSGSGLIGGGQSSTRLMIASTTAPAISVAADTFFVTLSDFFLNRTGTPGSSANGIIFLGDTQQANISNLWISGHWNGLAVRTTGYSTIRNIVVSANLNDGFNCADLPGHSGFQWYINTALSQLNGRNGFTFATGLGTTPASVGTWDNIFSFANTNYGLVAGGTAGQPINGVRLYNSFFGQDGQGEVFLDTYGGLHGMANVFLELAGTSTTGPTFSTAASGVGHGLTVTTNNTDFIANGLFSTGHSQSGMVLSASVMNAVSNSRFTFNANYGVVVSDGAKTVLNTSTFASNTLGTTFYSANAASVIAAGNSPSSIDNFISSAIANGTTKVLLGVANAVLYANASGILSEVVSANNAFLTSSGTGVPVWATPGTGVLTALGVSVGSAGAFVVNGGALGTPSSGVGTNLTALNASNLSSGTVAAARGGAGTITGALKGSGAGVVSQAACADLSNGVASCSTDTTNAANISSGTLPAARTNGHMNGTATNDNAAAGEVGEYISSTIASGSGVALTTNVPANVTSISLTAGDWDVVFEAAFTGAGTTTVTNLYSSISNTTATLDSGAGNISSTTYGASPSYNNVSFGLTLPVGPVRKSLSATTTIFAVAQSAFGVSTSNAYGVLRARRVR